MFCLGLQGHQIDNIDNTNLEVRDALANEIDSSESLKRRHVAGASHHYIRLTAAIIACPLPYPNSLRAML
jgi:hypothetical protein